MLLLVARFEGRVESMKIEKTCFYAVWGEIG